jgi:pimeloyl-ACP methyl ester carboxylesterase
MYYPPAQERRLDGRMHEFWVSADGCRLRYIRCNSPEAGSPTRPPILLVHGLLGYAFSWRFNMQALAQESPVYAVDLPGVGFSERPARLDRSFKGIANIVRRSLDEAGIRSFDLIGTSHGGAVAMMLAAAVPNRVRRLVLVASVHPWLRRGRRRISFLSSALGGFAFRSLWPCVAPLNSYFLSRMYGDPKKLTRETLAGYAAPLRIHGTCDHLVGVVRRWNADLQELEHALPAIASIPTLLLWGDRDTAVPVASADTLKRQFQHADLMVMKGAGHLPYEEVPDEFNAAVRGFLRQ